MLRPVVFTDLDGSLLDHESYSFVDARPALAALALRDIPVVPVTSKTRAELEPLMSDIGLTGGYIAENGAVIAHADGRVDHAANINVMRAAIDRLPRPVRAQMRCFGDMSPADISEATGLDTLLAERAARREATEPFVWLGEGTPPSDMLMAEGYQVTRGGRFFHIVPTRDKAAAMLLMMADMPQANESWALGDGPNDVAMLLAADRAALIANPHLAVPPVLPDGHLVYRTEKAGPQGWCDAIAFLLGVEIR